MKRKRGTRKPAAMAGAAAVALVEAQHVDFMAARPPVPRSPGYFLPALPEKLPAAPPEFGDAARLAAAVLALQALERVERAAADRELVIVADARQIVARALARDASMPADRHAIEAVIHEQEVRVH